MGPFLFMRSLRCSDLLDKTTLFLRTHFLGAAAFGDFDGQDGPATFWTGLADGRIPGCILALRIAVA